jgi:acyl dehydratase
MTTRDQRLHWEDFTAGEAVEFGRTEVSAADIIAYARAFDPDPAHLGEAAARNLEAGALTASDWHCCAMLMRMLCDDYLMNAAGAGAATVEHVKWFGRVRPGDVLTARRTPLETRASRSRPRIGIVRMLVELFNQRGEQVLSWLPVQFFERRDRDAAPPAPVSMSQPPGAGRAIRQPPDPDPGRAPAIRGGFEDMEPGPRAELGSHVFTREDMLGFATRFNPQYFHADEDAAAASLYGGLIASGWHTASVWNRLFVAHHLARAGTVPAGMRAARFGPSIAVHDMKWPNPVRPGDSVSYATRIIDRREVGAFPRWGIVVSENTGHNQRGEPVLGLTHEIWVERGGDG